jgi:hypothetical protein
MAIMGEGKKVYIYKTSDLMTPDEISPTELESDTRCYSLVWSPDSQKLALGSWYETIVNVVETKERVGKVQISAWNNTHSFVIHP